MRAAARNLGNANQQFGGLDEEDPWGWVLKESEQWMADLNSLQRNRQDRSARLWNQLRPEGRLLFACAVAIAVRCELREKELIPLLANIVAALRIA